MHNTQKEINISGFASLHQRRFSLLLYAFLFRLFFILHDVNIFLFLVLSYNLPARWVTRVIHLLYVQLLFLPLLKGGLSCLLITVIRP